jgi:glycosyltransferase involved in cell wall biosynthesis
MGALRSVPGRTIRNGIAVDHPRYLVVPKVGMSLTPHTLHRAMRKRFLSLRAAGYHFDLIDAHYFYPDGVAAVWLAQEFKLPVVVTARGTDLNLMPRFARPRRLIIDAAKEADGLITVCQALKDELVALGIAPSRVTVLRNGVDLQQFRPLDRAAARKEFGLSGAALASVGHLVERKGHHHVIRALTELPDTQLRIAGDGPLRKELENLAAGLGLADRVRFLGAVDQTRLCRLYNAVDALVLASHREGWANVLLEAMACGTPVVASAVWGTPEVVADPSAGVLMPSLDWQGVVAGIRLLRAHPPERTQTRRYAESFTWTSTSNGQLRLFRQIIDARRSAK